MNREVTIRLLHTLQDMLDNARVMADVEDYRVIKLLLTDDFALRFSDACGDAAKVLTDLLDGDET
jgi:hypothetical protein